MPYAPSAVERVMKVQEVILKAMSSRQPWLQVADVLGLSPRTVRRLRWRYEHYGYDGLFDRRRQTPSPRRAPVAEVRRILQLYRDRYGPRDGHPGFNVRHFYEIACRAHAVTLSYTFVKKLLQTARLVPTRRARGRHRRRREPRPCLGEMLLIDGSAHVWLALVPDQTQTLITVVDDATSRLLYAQLHATESTATIMTALRTVIETYGLPMALYTDRASWAFHTPQRGEPVERRQLTQVGRALAQLGIEHIPSYSPQARGRSERAHRTLQDRLVNELRLEGIRTLAPANRYLCERFLPAYDQAFARPPADPTTAFVPLGVRVDLDTIFCIEDERTVSRDNGVTFEGVRMQIAKQRGRRTCAGLRVRVRRHLDGRHAIWYGTRCLGEYDAQGRPRLQAA